MKTILSLAFFVCAYTTAFSQVIFAPSRVMFMGDNTPVIRSDEGTLRLRRTQNEKSTGWNKSNYKISVMFYDQHMRLSVKNDLANGDYAFNSIEPRMVRSGNSVWVIYAMPGNKNNIGDIIAEQLDGKTLKSIGKSTIVTEAELDESVAIYLNGPKCDFILKNSPDSKYHSLLIDNGRGDFFISCLDNNMKPIWKKRQDLPGFKHEDITGMAVNNEGTIFMSAVKKESTTVSSFSVSGSFSQQVVVMPGDIKPDKASVFTGNNNDVYIGGVGMKDSKNVNNFFLGKLAKDGSLSAFKSLDLPDTMIDRLHKDGLAKEKSNKSGIMSYYLNPEIIQQSNGRIKLILECKQGLGKDGTQYMAYGSLIIADFDAPQKNFLIIPKYTVGSYTFSYDNQFLVVPSANKITLYYYDNADNLDRELSEPQKVLKGASNAALIAADIDDNGKIKRKSVEEVGN